MLTIDRPPESGLTASGAARGVLLRVRPNGPAVDLPLGKTTIGSSPRCNIRIQQPGIQPLHCLILRDENGLTIRRWAGETLLNGQPVEEAPIDAGDSFQVGPVELELAAPPSAPVDTPFATASPSPTRQATSPAAPATSMPALSTTAAPAAASPPPLSPNGSSRDHLGRDLARARSRRLLSALRAHRGLADELQQRVANLELDLERLTTESTGLNSQLENLTAELAEARRAAAALQAAEATCQELASQNEHLGREACSMIERIEQLRSELSESSAALQSALLERESFTAEGRRLAEIERQLSEQLEQQTNRCQALSAERDEASRQSESLQAELRTIAEREAAVANSAEQTNDELLKSRERASELSSQNGALIAERDEAWRQCEALRSNILALSERESSLAESVARLEHDSSHHQSRYDELQIQINEACRERDEARQECESMRAEAQSLRTRETDLSDSVRRLEQNIGDYQSQVHELSTQISDLGNQRDEAWRQCESSRGEVASLSERESALLENIRGLEHQVAERAGEHSQLASEIGALRAAHDDLRDQNELLRSQVKNLVEERATLTEEHAADNRELESLRRQLHAASDKEAEHREELATLRSECQAYREAADLVPQLEQKVREAVADRENTSSELYRALLQLAEMQERDDHHAALEAAHQAVTSELEKSAAEIAALQAQVNRLGEERTAADEVRQSLDRRSAELIESHQQLAYDKSALNAELADVRAQLDSSRQREAEAAAQLDTAAVAGQRLADAEQALVERAETIARLEAELNDRLECETQATASIAERDEQIDRLTKLLAESRDGALVLERQLVASSETVAQFELARDEWRHERETSGKNQAKLQQRVDELEAKLADAEAAIRLAAKSAESTAAQAQLEQKCDEWREELEQVARERSQLLERVAELESQLAEAQNAASLAARSSETLENSTRTLGDCPDSVESLEQNESAPCSESVLLPSLNSGAITHQCAPVEADPTSDGPSVATHSPVPESQPTSFIERYSHLLAADGAVEPQQSAPVAAGVADGEVGHWSTVGGMRSAEDATTRGGDGDEESIEDYMAKLLQRVRGESTPHAVTAPTAVTKKPVQAPKISNPAQFASGPLSAPSHNVDGHFASPMDSNSAKRKSSVSDSQTDLEALRALANESARRAITRHAMRKHRRNMITKVIVSTLAGMTSLWLMLESESWWNLQSITACVSMLVAAYWAGETIRTLMQSLRGETAEEMDDGIEELSAKLRSPLPIDVEDTQPWSSQ